MQLKQFVMFLLLASCGFTLVEDQTSVSFNYNADNYENNITLKHLYNLLTKDKQFDTSDYICNITNLEITNSRIATNSSGEDASYKFAVNIAYEILNNANEIIDKNSYSFIEIYQIDDSLYSNEVKNSELLSLVPDSFDAFLKQKLLLGFN
jgi:hypothetical protein